MKVGKSRLIALSSLVALAGVAALAIGSQGGSDFSAQAESASGAKLTNWST